MGLFKKFKESRAERKREEEIRKREEEIRKREEEIEQLYQKARDHYFAYPYINKFLNEQILKLDPNQTRAKKFLAAVYAGSFRDFHPAEPIINSIVELGLIDTEIEYAQASIILYKTFLSPIQVAIPLLNEASELFFQLFRKTQTTKLKFEYNYSNYTANQTIIKKFKLTLNALGLYYDSLDSLTSPPKKNVPGNEQGFLELARGYLNVSNQKIYRVGIDFALDRAFECLMSIKGSNVQICNEAAKVTKMLVSFDWSNFYDDKKKSQELDRPHFLFFNVDQDILKMIFNRIIYFYHKSLEIDIQQIDTWHSLRKFYAELHQYNFTRICDGAIASIENNSNIESLASKLQLLRKEITPQQQLQNVISEWIEKKQVPSIEVSITDLDYEIMKIATKINLPLNAVFPSWKHVLQPILLLLEFLIQESRKDQSSDNKEELASIVTTLLDFLENFSSLLKEQRDRQQKFLDGWDHLGSSTMWIPNQDRIEWGLRDIRELPTETLDEIINEKLRVITKNLGWDALVNFKKGVVMGFWAPEDPMTFVKTGIQYLFSQMDPGQEIAVNTIVNQLNQKLSVSEAKRIISELIKSGELRASLNPVTEIVRYGTTSLKDLEICFYCGNEVNAMDLICPSCERKVLECSICYSRIVFNQSAGECPKCITSFHYDHLMEWLKMNGTCPMCSVKLNISEINIIESKIMKFSSE